MSSNWRWPFRERRGTAQILVNEDYFFLMLNPCQSWSLRKERKGKFVYMLCRAPGVFAVSPGIKGNSTEFAVVVRIIFPCHNFQHYFIVALHLAGVYSWFQWCFKWGKKDLAARSTEVWIYLQLIGPSTPIFCIKYKDMAKGKEIFECNWIGVITVKLKLETGYLWTKSIARGEALTQKPKTR